MRSADMQKSRPTCRNGRPRCKNFEADVCGWPSEMQKLCGRCLRLAVRDAKTLRPMFAVGCPRCKKLCGRCLRSEFFASRTANRKHRPQSFLHLGQPTANIGRRVFCISDSQPQTSAAEFFASRTANRKHRPQSFLHLGRPTANIGRRVFCISDGQPRGSMWKAFLQTSAAEFKIASRTANHVVVRGKLFCISGQPQTSAAAVLYLE